MPALRELLGLEFRALEAALGLVANTYKTQRSQAERLGEPASSYSKALNGGSLSEESARRWATLLCDSRAAPDSEDLARRLVEAAAADVASLRMSRGGPSTEADGCASVCALFDRLADAARRSEASKGEIAPPILIVEYRDLPRAQIGRRYPQVLKPAGRALAAGLRVALFQPFRVDSTEDGSQSEECWPPEVFEYRRNLANSVRVVARQMWESAVASSVDASEQVRGQLCLYESTAREVAGSGVGTRMFFTDYFDGRERRQEVWEWGAGRDGDWFLLRDEAALPWTAFAYQFFPVFAQWRRTTSLPNEADIQAILADADVRSEFRLMGKGQPTWPWMFSKVYSASAARAG